MKQLHVGLADAPSPATCPPASVPSYMPPLICSSLRRPPHIPPLQDCPKSASTSLVAPVEGDDSDALNFALVRALRAASFSSSFVEGASFDGANRAVINTPGNAPDLTFAVTAGSLGSAVAPAATAADACGSAANCASGTTAGRYTVSVGSFTIKALCPAGHECDGTAKTACEAGWQATFAGSSACAQCEVDTYAADAGNSHCIPCPAYSHAHFTGSTGCLACFFGEPRLVAGTFDDAAGATPLFPDNMPSEQPSTGERQGGGGRL